MENNRRRTGARYEQTAGRYLETRGYQILEYNYRCRRGEIDIIARDQECLVFCEVKYRSGPGAGDAAEAVDAKKQRKLSVCALFYLTSHGLMDTPCRFDVVSITGNKIRLYRDAFPYAGS